MKSELIVHEKPKSNVAEAFKTIRTNLQFSSIDEEVKSILITSSIPGEGKSFVSANLAIAFAQAGKRVLIVDCDLRRGRQHEIFKINNNFGLSNLLIDNTDRKDDKYFHKTEIKNLFVLPRGIVPPNPSEILASEKNRNLVKILEKTFDMVIYDGPPVNGLADSIIMSGIVKKVIIVSAYKSTKIEQLQNTRRGLEKFESKIAGIIVNKMPTKRDHYYSYYE